MKWSISLAQTSLKAWSLQTHFMTMKTEFYKSGSSLVSSPWQLQSAKRYKKMGKKSHEAGTDEGWFYINMLYAPFYICTWHEYMRPSVHTVCMHAICVHVCEVKTVSDECIAHCNHSKWEVLLQKSNKMHHRESVNMRGSLHSESVVNSTAWKGLDVCGRQRWKMIEESFSWKKKRPFMGAVFRR